MQQAAARARIWPYVLVLCLAFIGFVVALVPVRSVWEQISTPQMEMQPSGLRGTLWQGSADWVEWQTHAVQAVRWSFHPWGLLRGVWEYQVALQYEGAAVTGFAGISLSGAMQGRDLQAQALLQDMHALMNQSAMYLPAVVQGDLQVDLTELAIADTWPVALQGQIVLNSLGLAGLAELGDWQGQLSQTDDQSVMLQFAPAADDLLQGEGQWILSPDQTWKLTLKIRPVRADSEISVLADLVGTADQQGYLAITQQGKWH